MNSSTGKLKYAEWYYGPQKRLMASLKAEYDLNGVIFDHASILVAYQNVEEDRINRSFGKSWKKFNLENVGVITVNADFDKKLGKKDDLRYGIEFDYNDVHSKAHQENIKTGESAENIGTRYPDQKGNMMTLAAYISNNWNISRVFAFSQGIRFSYVTLNAAYSDTMMKIMKFPFDQNISQKNANVTGYLGLTMTPGHDWKISLIGSTGFRAPNIDDLTKLNESNSTDKTIIVPNPDLKPEYAYNAEISVGKTIIHKVRLEGTFFYTWLKNAFVVGPTTFNGKDSLEYDGVVCKVMSQTNAGGAYVYGVQANLLAQVTRSFSIVSNLTYTFGRVVNPEEAPLDHIPPVYGMTSFRLELKKFKGDFYVMYNGWKRISQYSPSGEDNQAYATEYGMPSWYTLNLKLSYQIIRYLNVEIGVENILNENYRKFASGISSPGRNIIAALRATF
jgi:hemoglobin/transferrin/lactoferrin receptor protein